MMGNVIQSPEPIPFLQVTGQTWSRLKNEKFVILELLKATTFGHREWRLNVRMRKRISHFLIKLIFGSHISLNCRPSKMVAYEI